VVAAQGEAFGESASDLAGGSGDEDFHIQNVVLGGVRELEETDIMRGSLRDRTRAVRIPS
jgi:hypothetical protein